MELIIPTTSKEQLLMVKKKLRNVETCRAESLEGADFGSNFVVAPEAQESMYNHLKTHVAGEKSLIRYTEDPLLKATDV